MNAKVARTLTLSSLTLTLILEPHWVMVAAFDLLGPPQASGMNLNPCQGGRRDFLDQLDISEYHFQNHTAAVKPDGAGVVRPRYSAEGYLQVSNQ